MFLFALLIAGNLKPLKDVTLCTYSRKETQKYYYETTQDNEVDNKP